MALWNYDVETFPNIFTCGLKNSLTGERVMFEFSWRRNHIPKMLEFFGQMVINGDKMVGFNNLGFDYPVLHFIIETPSCSVTDIYMKAMSIINTPWDRRFDNVIWDRDQHIPQIDLYKVHHFDNFARATSLKVLEFNMRRERVEDLPFTPGTILNWEQCDTLITYNWEDIDATEQFFFESSDQLRFREELSEKYNRNFMNHNDTKIGKDYFIMQMEKLVPGFNKRNQTKRSEIRIADIIFPYIKFDHPEFNRVLNWLRSQVIVETKGVFTDINCVIDGFQFDFGTGGIHGSVESQIVESDEDYIIEDWDVTSFYTNLAISNNLFPEHLGQEFCNIYKEVYEQRQKYAKGTTENDMLKLALNGVYGDSNNKYSCFFDPQYTMAITINGQLLLCMLAEVMLKQPAVRMIQVNTDGLTVKYPRSSQPWIRSVVAWWEELSGLKLESAEYNRMFIRDVNNYIAEYATGSLKRKGAYEYELGWHKNHSALVVPMAAEAALVRGEDIRTFIENHKDIFDFMLRTKVPKNSRLVGVDYRDNDLPLQNTTRYYISVMGLDLIKIMPPLKGKIHDRRLSIDKGWKATVCNDMNNFVDADIEHEYYVRAAEKLVEPLRR